MPAKVKRIAPPPLEDVVLEAMTRNDFDVEVALGELDESFLEGDDALWNAYAGELVREALRARLVKLVHRQRQEIANRKPGEPGPEASARYMEACRRTQALCTSSVYDFRLEPAAGGVRLGDAVWSQVDKQAQRYGARESQERSRRLWFEAIREKIPDDDSEPVSAMLTPDEILELRPEE